MLVAAFMAGMATEMEAGEIRLRGAAVVIVSLPEWLRGWT